MRAIQHLDNVNDVNLKIWNGLPNGTILAPAIPFEISQDEFKLNIMKHYQDVEDIKYDTRTKIGKYAAYIIFNDQKSFQRACHHNLSINNIEINTFAARQYEKELKAYRFNENEYKKEFPCYLQYCLDMFFANNNKQIYNKNNKISLTLDELRKVYEEICNVPWINQPKYENNSFDNRIYKMWITGELDERVILNDDEKELAENKYYYLLDDDNENVNNLDLKLEKL